MAYERGVHCAVLVLVLVVPCFASLSALSFPGISQCPKIYTIVRISTTHLGTPVSRARIQRSKHLFPERYSFLAYRRYRQRGLLTFAGIIRVVKSSLLTMWKVNQFPILYEHDII